MAALRICLLPESPALKLPGCGQPCYHGNCILHPCHCLHLKAIRENRGTGETEEGEETVAWLHSPSFPGSSQLPTQGASATQASPLVPGGAASHPAPPSPAPTTWRPQHSALLLE